MHKRILLPTDGSKNAERAGEYAISLADLSGADIIVLNVIDTYYLNAITQPDVRESVDEELRASVKKAIERFEEKIEENKFITNVPRDQKWLRIEPISNLSPASIERIAKESNLSVNLQKDGRLVVYGQQEGIRDFLKKITLETTKK